MSTPTVYQLYRWKETSPGDRVRGLHNHGIPLNDCPDLMRRPIIVASDHAPDDCNPRDIASGFWIPRELLIAIIVPCHIKSSHKPSHERTPNLPSV